MTDKDLKFLIMSDNHRYLTLLETALGEQGYDRIDKFQELSGLKDIIPKSDADMVIIKLGNNDGHILEDIFEVTTFLHKPLAIFIDESSNEMIRRAIEAGVGAYVIDGFRASRIKSIIELTLNRFNKFEKLLEQRDEAVDALKKRKIIDKAKGLLMARDNLSEDEAYKLIRKTAMKQSKKMTEIAEIVITMLEMSKEINHSSCSL